MGKIVRILICADSLGYGGAETHIIGLARGLYEMGHSVTLASPPGELKQALPRGGEFIEVPTYGRKPWMLVRSKMALRKIIKHGEFNIVHAHARLPAFLAASPAKRYGAAFVVTAHAKFFMSPLLSRLSNWGAIFT